MIISIASGKGGTGKTTVAVNLALSLENVQLLDCDVEEPNDNLFLNAKITEREEVKRKYPVIDKEKCNLCGQCATFCMYNAIAIAENNVIVFPELCNSCLGCKLVCPRNAIEYEDRVVGYIEHGRKGNIDFYQGISNIGETRITPIIKQLKKKIDKNKIVILDAPPGASCPMIESIDGTDFCILVTEPTPFGLYDLKIAVDVVRRLKMKFGVIINKDGIGDKKVELFCQRENIPILMKIPFSIEFASLYSKGIPFVEEFGEWKKNFRKLYRDIKGMFK